MNFTRTRAALTLLALLLALAPMALADEPAKTDYPGIEREVWLDELDNDTISSLEQHELALYRYAAVQASIMSDLIESQGFSSIAANKYPDCEELVAQVDLKHPKYVSLAYCPADELDMLYMFGEHASEVPTWFADDARSIICNAMFEWLCAPDDWYAFSAGTALNEAASLADMDGLCYVFQYWDNGDVFLVTSIYTYDYPHVMTCTRLAPPVAMGSVLDACSSLMDYAKTDINSIAVNAE